MHNVDAATKVKATTMMRRYGAAKCRARRSTRDVSTRSRRSSSLTAPNPHTSVASHRVDGDLELAGVVALGPRRQHFAIAATSGEQLLVRTGGEHTSLVQQHHRVG